MSIHPLVQAGSPCLPKNPSAQKEKGAPRHSYSPTGPQYLKGQEISVPWVQWL